MANCAEKIMRANGYGDQIKLVRKRSTQVEVGANKDMERRANILVTEVFDTELIGEAAIATFNHAHKHLLTVRACSFGAEELSDEHTRSSLFLRS